MWAHVRSPLGGNKLGVSFSGRVNNEPELCRVTVDLQFIKVKPGRDFGSNISTDKPYVLSCSWCDITSTVRFNRNTVWIHLGKELFRVSQLYSYKGEASHQQNQEKSSSDLIQMIQSEHVNTNYPTVYSSFRCSCAEGVDYFTWVSICMPFNHICHSSNVSAHAASRAKMFNAEGRKNKHVSSNFSLREPRFAWNREADGIQPGWD